MRVNVALLIILQLNDIFKYTQNLFKMYFMIVSSLIRIPQYFVEDLDHEQNSV